MGRHQGAGPRFACEMPERTRAEFERERVSEYTLDERLKKVEGDVEQLVDERRGKVDHIKATFALWARTALLEAVTSGMEEGAKRLVRAAMDRVDAEIQRLWECMGRVYERLSKLEDAGSTDAAERVRLLSERVTALERSAPRGLTMRNIGGHLVFGDFPEGPARGLKPLDPPMTADELALSYEIVPPGTVAHPKALAVLYEAFRRQLGQEPGMTIDLIKIERAGQLVTETVRRRLVEKDAPG